MNGHLYHLNLSALSSSWRISICIKLQTVFASGGTLWTCLYCESVNTPCSAWTKNGLNKFERTFIQFDFSAVPNGARITAAQLDLTNDGSPHGGGNSSRYGQSSVYLSRVTGHWNEYNITWNNMPGISTTDRLAIPAPATAYAPMSADVTTLVKDILNSEAGNNGFEMRLADRAKVPQRTLCQHPAQ